MGHLRLAGAAAPRYNTLACCSRIMILWFLISLMLYCTARSDTCCRYCHPCMRPPVAKRNIIHCRWLLCTVNTKLSFLGYLTVTTMFGSGVRALDFHHRRSQFTEGPSSQMVRVHRRCEFIPTLLAKTPEQNVNLYLFQVCSSIEPNWGATRPWTWQPLLWKTICSTCWDSNIDLHFC